MSFVAEFAADCADALGALRSLDADRNRLEEALVEQLEAAGEVVFRRADARPEVVLGQKENSSS